MYISSICIIGCAKESTLKYLINLYCIVSAIYQNSDTNLVGSGPRGTLLGDNKIKILFQK